MLSNKDLLDVLLHQREHKVDDSMYKMIQCDFAYNSNHMEGSRLTPEQTRMVFGRKFISGENIALDKPPKKHLVSFKGRVYLTL